MKGKLTWAREISLDFPSNFLFFRELELWNPGTGYQKPIRNWNINFPVWYELWMWNNFHYSEFFTGVQVPFCPSILWLCSFKYQNTVCHLKWNSEKRTCCYPFNSLHINQVWVFSIFCSSRFFPLYEKFEKPLFIPPSIYAPWK